VIEHDGSILACAALYPYAAEKSAELACLAVAPEVRDAGYGERLLLACEARAKEMKSAAFLRSPTRAPALVPDPGFSRRPGFRCCRRSARRLYNWKRRVEDIPETNLGLYPTWQEW
jgi:amino-acid N-acetyltransferase